MNEGDVGARPASSVPSWDDEADVVVVGGGCAGAAAAIEAASTGADVILLEKASGGGGASAMSGGLLYLGGGTPVQTACGFEDDPESMYRFLVAAMGPEPDTARLAAYADGSVEHFGWLEAHGVEFARTFWPHPSWTPPTDDGLMWLGENSHPFTEVARPAPRGHRPLGGSGRVGNVLMTALLHAATRAARVRTDTGLQRLVTGDDGRVVGAIASRYGQEVAVRARGGVVLAAGGFVFNDEMLRTHAPRLLPHTKLGTDHDDGRAIRAAAALGAAMRNMDAGEASINFSPALMARSIIVDRFGNRFINEDTYGGRIGQHGLFHREGRAYLVFDEEAHESVPEELRHGRVPDWACATVEELEGEIGLPPGSLVATIDAYNREAAAGRDPLFHKQEQWLRPLRPPIGAMDVRAKRQDGPPDPADRGTGFRVFTLGGLHTTPHGEVLHVVGEPIPGLYAAGRTASGLSAWGYISGTSLGDGTFFGRRAGRAAATSAR